MPFPARLIEPTGGERPDGFGQQESGSSMTQGSQVVDLAIFLAQMVNFRDQHAANDGKRA